ncbi:hypothetical protein H0N96_02230 [Candidatus Micrarchaeota archaeon]|nr:hypothetical protein [Candidatus Micrarchaeota archaeon]
MFKLSFPRLWGKPARGEVEQRETTVQQLKAEVQERKARVEKESAARLFKQIVPIKKPFQALLAAVKTLENAQVSEQTAGFKIAVQEKKNFLERFHSLASGFAFPENEKNTPEFVKELDKFVKAAAKNFSDNKYLYAFYRNETRAVGEAINALNAAREELEQIEKQGEKQAGECEAVLQKISRLELTRASAVEAAREKQELMQKIEKLRAESAEADKSAERAKKDAQRLREEIAHVEKSAFVLKQEAYSVFAPLERPLRKMQKSILDKRLAQVADACVENFLKEAECELHASGSLSDLVKVAVLVEEKIKELARDEKEEAKTREAVAVLHGGSVEKALRKALEFESQAKVILKELRQLEETSASAASVREKLAAVEKRSSDADEFLTQLKRDFQQLKAEADEKASALFGERIILTDVL